MMCLRPVYMSVCQSVCLSVYLFVCLIDSSYISKTTSPNFTKFSVHATCGGGSVLWTAMQYVMYFRFYVCFQTMQWIVPDSKITRMFRPVCQTAPRWTLPSPTSSCGYCVIIIIIRPSKTSLGCRDSVPHAHRVVHVDGRSIWWTGDDIR